MKDSKGKISTTSTVTNVSLAAIEPSLTTSTQLSSSLDTTTLNATASHVYKQSYYKFSYIYGGEETVLRNYGTSSTINYTPKDFGTYTYKLYAKDVRGEVKTTSKVVRYVDISAVNKDKAVDSVTASVGKIQNVYSTILGDYANSITNAKFYTSDESICTVTKVANKTVATIMPISEGTCSITVKGLYKGIDVHRFITVHVSDPGNVKVGLDLSHWNGTINPTTFKNNNIDYVILRSGHGTYADSKFTTYAKQCYNANLDFGVYWYLGGGSSAVVTTNDAIAQANKCVDMLSKIKSYQSKMSYPIFLDLEDESLYTGISSSKSIAYIQSLSQAFIKVLNKAGYTKIGIYANKYWLETYLDNSYFASFEYIWQARYYVTGTKPSVSMNNKKITPYMWQTNSVYDIHGMSSSYSDMNYLYE